MHTDRDVRSQQDAAIGPLRHGLDNSFDVGKTMNTSNDRLDGKRSGSVLKWPIEKSGGRVIRIVDHRNMRNIWCDLFERLQHLADAREFKNRKSSDVTTRSGKTFHPASFDRRNAARDDDRN